MKLLFSALGALMLGAGVFTTVNLTQKQQLSDLTLANIEAMTKVNNGDSFWFDDTHWYSDGTTGGGNWNPIYESCTSGGISGHQIRCSTGGGNCWNGTSCVRGS